MSSTLYLKSFARWNLSRRGVGLSMRPFLPGSSKAVTWSSKTGDMEAERWGSPRMWAPLRCARICVLMAHGAFSWAHPFPCSGLGTRLFWFKRRLYLATEELWKGWITCLSHICTTYRTRMMIILISEKSVCIKMLGPTSGAWQALNRG